MTTIDLSAPTSCEGCEHEFAKGEVFFSALRFYLGDRVPKMLCGTCVVDPPDAPE